MTKAERQAAINAYAESLGMKSPSVENMPVPKVRKLRGKYKRKPRDRSHYRACTREERQEMVRNKICAICKTSPAKWVDHDHVTGKIREPLCNRCNAGLGFFDDDIERLRGAAQYVQSHKGI